MKARQRRGCSSPARSGDGDSAAPFSSPAATTRGRRLAVKLGSGAAGLLQLRSATQIWLRFPVSPTAALAAASPLAFLPHLPLPRFGRLLVWLMAVLRPRRCFSGRDGFLRKNPFSDLALLLREIRTLDVGSFSLQTVCADSLDLTMKNLDDADPNLDDEPRQRTTMALIPVVRDFLLGIKSMQCNASNQSHTKKKDTRDLRGSVGSTYVHGRTNHCIKTLIQTLHKQSALATVASLSLSLSSKPYPNSDYLYHYSRV